MTKKSIFSLGLLLFVILLACEQEFSLSSFKATKRDIQSEVEHVRLWYDHNKPQSVQTKSGLEDELLITMAPNWNESFLRENDNYETVEVAATMNKRITYMTPEVREKYFSTKNAVYKQDMRRFVFLTDKKTNTLYSFVMLIIPDLIYLEKTNFKPFRENTYLERGNDFSGYILYYELDGTFTNGWKYEEGKLAYTVTESPYRYNGVRPQSIETRALDCSQTDMYQLVEECTDYYYYAEYEGGSTDWQYSHTTCEYYDEYTGTVIECVSHDKNGNHGGGDYLPPTYPIDQSMGKYGTIYAKESTLIDNEKQFLVGALDALTTQKPIYETLIKRLEENKIKIRFQIGQTRKDNKGNWIPAVYTLDGAITFIDKNAINSVNLEEPILHAVRYLDYGNKFDVSVLNYDLEVNYFRDIVNSRLGISNPYFASVYQKANIQSEYTNYIRIFSSRSLKESDLSMFDYFSKNSELGNLKFQIGFEYLLLKKYLVGY